MHQDDTDYLFHVDSNSRPPEEVQYQVSRKKIHYRLHKLFFDKQEQFEAHFYTPPTFKEERKLYKNADNKSLEIDKVQTLTAPVGENGESKTIATFYYNSGYTDVWDVDHILTRYHYDSDTGLTDIIYYDATQNPYSSIKFLWSHQRLRAKIKLDGNGQALFSKTFEYDGAGNVTKETLWGNLSGSLPSSFSLNADGSLAGAESYTKTYSYLPKFNLPLIEQEEEGLTYKYFYQHETDLLTAKFTQHQDQILLREFYVYNDQYRLIEEIVDDGSSENPHDLTNITKRLISRYEVNLLNGLTTSKSEYYLDLNNQKETLLKRSVYTYGPQKLVDKEDVYDAEGNFRYSLHTSHDPAGHVLASTTPIEDQVNTYTYDSQGRLVRINEVGALTYQYNYDKAGRPYECIQIDALGNSKTTRSTYDAKGRLITQTDPQGHSTYQKYDEFGRCIETIFPLSTNFSTTPSAQFKYDVQGNLIASISPNKDTILTEYNTLRKPTHILYPDGSSISHLYNKNGTLQKTILQDKSEVHYEYDIFQRTTAKITVSSDGKLLSEERWDYDSFHLLSYTDTRNLTTFYHYDGAGRKILEDTGGRKRAYHYDALGFVQKIEEENASYNQILDVGGRVIEEWIEQKDGSKENHMKFSYNLDNKKSEALRFTSKGWVKDQFFYDAEGRLTTHIDPLGNKTQYIYKINAINLSYKTLQKITIDPSLNQTIETFDGLNRLWKLEKKDPNNNLVFSAIHSYDSSGNRKETLFYRYPLPKTTWDHIITRWEYDALGRVIKEREGSKKTTLFSYDEKGRLKTKTLPSHVDLFYTYDALDRVIELKSSDKSIHYKYRYDKGIEPIEIIDLVQKKEAHYTYNAFGELIKEVGFDGFCSSWEYDLSGHCTKFTLPDKSSILYSYKGDHLILIQRQNVNGKILYEHRYLEFDPNGHVAKEALIHNLGSLTTRHDELERIASHSSEFYKEFISYNASSLVSKVTNHFGETAYNYDALNQLKEEGNKTYAFDSLGNPIKARINNLNQIEEIENIVISYDTNGNPKEKFLLEDKNISQTQRISYEFDALGRLTNLAFKGKFIELFYDPFSKLTSSVSHTYNPELQIYEKKTTYYLYDRGFEIGAMNEKGVLYELKVLGLGIKGDLSASVAIELNDEVFVPIHNFSGNLIALVQSDKTYKEFHEIDAFGKKLDPGQFISPWCYCSKRHIEGLVYFGKRFYDPSLGRWLSPDPAGFVDGPNLYAYVLNSPLNRLDLFGLEVTLFSLGNQIPSPYASLIPSSSNVNVPITTSLQSYCLTSHANDLIHVKGYIGQVPTDFFVSPEHIIQLQFTPEERIAGQANIIDHFSEFFTNESSGIGLLTQENGIRNSLQEAHQKSSYTYQNLEGSPLFIGLYNPDLGLIRHVRQVFKEINYISGPETSAVIQKRQFMVTILEQFGKVNPGILWLDVLHSEAGVITQRAIEGMTEDQKTKLKERLLILAIAPALPVSKAFTKEAINIYSEKDNVTLRFGRDYIGSPQYDIRIVECKTNLGFFNRTMGPGDHDFMGQTYKAEVKGWIGELYKNPSSDHATTR